MFKYIIFCVILCAEVCFSQLFANKCWPLNKNVATSRATPININTFTAKPVYVTPLLQKGITNERNLLVNTGNGLEVRTLQPSQGILTGGVLYNETYIYHSTRYFWSNNNTNIVEHSINGVGTTLAAEVIYYNKKYNNFNNSLNHYDGLAIVSVLIRVCSTPNFAFNMFQCYLEKVTQPKSQLQIDSASPFIWFDFVKPFGNYYAYPGSYTDVDNCRIYNCATVLVFPLSTASPFISCKQFASSFGLLKNTAGKPLTYAATRYPVAGRPVSCAVGIKEVIALHVPNQ